ncbi:hypothetical protein PVAND_000568 [Polypedilum vanderplanki]|uniref:MRH domain-containing protein n=1 Tax=Polypedilum vanderplanki TaxID=319348 RepID=A0A9J6BKC9_POLVA|nr:hypothetical protein PVAND_000568 [Polypedilum vanderplanki]
MKYFAIFLLVINFCNIIAIDQTKDVEGANCSVTETIGNYTFNFTELSSDFGYHIDGNAEDMGKYSFNLCKPLSRKCNNQTAAACLKNVDGKEIIIGYDSTSKLFWNDGQIRFSFIGEKCNKLENYTLNVILQCDYAETKNDFLGVFHDDSECEVTILMRTPKACLEIPENVKNAKMYVTSPNGKILNFNALKSSNHIINGPNDGTFIIGFPITYEHGILCEAGSSICYVDKNETDLSKKYTNMGTMTSNIEFENDRPVIKFTSKEKCNNNTLGSSKIVFECDRFKKEGTPKFKGVKDCVSNFVWETSLACYDEKPCVVSGENGDQYDFSSLANVQYEVKIPNKTDETIYFSICSNSKECGEGNWGSCIVKNTGGNKQTTKVGIFNAKLQVEKKNVFLKYDEGSQCGDPKDKKKYSTRIEFNVADSPNDEEIVLIEDKCEIVIHFKTLLANQHVKNCVVKNLDDEEIDLRPLIDYNGNYLARVNETTLPNETSKNNVSYLLNVCRPINSFYSLNCHGNTGACRTIMKDEKHEEEISLGHFEYFMSTEKGKIEGTNNVIMKYFHGSKCPTDKEEEITTKVKFYCDENAGLGSPILQSIEHCEYSFEFPTSILCNDKRVNLKSNESCILTNGDSSVNLKSYGNFNTSNRNISLCDALVKTYTISYKQSMVIIEYVDKDYVDIEVQLKCNLKNNTFVDVSNEGIIIMNESPLICPLLHIVPKATPSQNEVDNDNNDVLEMSLNNDIIIPKSSKFPLGYLFLISILIAAFGIFYIVIRNPERRDIIRNMIKFRSRSNVRYTRNMNDDDLILN